VNTHRAREQKHGGGDGKFQGDLGFHNFKGCFLLQGRDDGITISI
jgi:hypothetical protein